MEGEQLKKKYKHISVSLTPQEMGKLQEDLAASTGVLAAYEKRRSPLQRLSLSSTLPPRARTLSTPQSIELRGDLPLDETAKLKLLYETTKSGQRAVLAGTVDDFIALLLSTKADEEFSVCFFYVYLHFITPEALLRKIYLKFKEFPSNITPELLEIQAKRILLLLEHWYSVHYCDFHMNKAAEMEMNTLLDLIRQVAALRAALTETDVITEWLSGINRSVKFAPCLYHLHKNKVFSIEALAEEVVNFVVYKKEDVLHLKKKQKKKHGILYAEELQTVLMNELNVGEEVVQDIIKVLLESKRLVVPKKNKGELSYKLLNLPQKAKVKEHLKEGSKFSDFDAKDVARQLTLMEFALFSAITQRELHDKAWTSNNPKQSAPNVIAMIDNFNKISYWVGTEIVSTLSISERVELVAKFISIAEYCKEMHNFSTMMQIIVGLNLSPVTRLEKTWKAVKPKALGVFKSLMEFTSSSNNYKAYRSHLEGVKPPCIPQLGIYMKDLTFVEDGNSNFFSECHEVLNFGKMRMLGGIVAELHRFQQMEYLFIEDGIIQQYIANVQVYTTDKELRDLSLSCEPSYRHSIAGPMDTKTLSGYLASASASANLAANSNSEN